MAMYLAAGAILAAIVWLWRAPFERFVDRARRGINGVLAWMVPRA